MNGTKIVLVVFVLVIIMTISYVVFYVGLVHVPVIIQPFTVPIGISGFFAIGGDIKGSLLQFFGLAISALLYYPICKAWERILIAREEEAGPLEAVQVQTPAKVG